MRFKSTLWLFWSAAILTTVVAGTLAGTFNNRWGIAAEMQAAGARLENISKSFGNWEMMSSQDVGRGTQEMLQCAGSAIRVYRNRETGQTVSLALLVGPPGPISVHTPEICYSSRDYTELGSREKLSIDGLQKNDEGFWRTTFRKNDLHTELLHVVYGWSTGGAWYAPKEARFSFAGQRFLYKLQIAAALSDGPTTHDPCRDFLKEFLPVLQGELISAHE